VNVLFFVLGDSPNISTKVLPPPPAAAAAALLFITVTLKYLNLHYEKIILIITQHSEIY
jgi:hypothetical protein